jgi:hypothetical protein
VAYSVPTTTHPYANALHNTWPNVIVNPRDLRNPEDYPSIDLMEIQLEKVKVLFEDKWPHVLLGVNSTSAFAMNVFQRSSKTVVVLSVTPHLTIFYIVQLLLFANGITSELHNKVH